jgi:hypothetical protein
MKEPEVSTWKCPNCKNDVVVRNHARDVTKLFCTGMNCALWFTPLGRIISDREAMQIPASHKLWDVFAGITSK